MMVTFHQGLHGLLKQNLSLGKEIQHFLENITFDLSIYIMEHPDLNVFQILWKILLVINKTVNRQSKVACGFW